jgi:hypothetical protein
MLRSLALGSILLFSSARALAQTPLAEGLRPGPSVLRVSIINDWRQSPLNYDSSDSTSHPSYWLEGALVGGALGGLGLTAFALAACSDSDSGSTGPCWGNVLLGAGFGFAGGATLGALLGGLIPKPERSPADSLIAD